jgi:hypothetical protein
MRPSSRDSEREAAIVSKVALTTGMINSVPLVMGWGKADFSPVHHLVKEALTLTESPWTTSEILLHQAQFQIRDAAHGEESPLAFRRTLHSARNLLTRDRSQSLDERWRTSQLLNEIEARGILTLSRNRSDISEAERLANQFSEVASSHPLRRLQHRYLEVALAAIHGESNAEKLKRGLPLSPELSEHPHQIVRIIEVQATVDDILSNQPGHERYYLN